MKFTEEQDKLAAMIIGHCEQDAEYASMVFDNFHHKYFPYEAEIVFKAYRNFYNETGELPNREVIALTKVKADDTEDIKEFLDLVDSFQDSNLPTAYVKEKTALFHKRMAFEQMMLDVVDAVDTGEMFDAEPLDKAE